MIARPNSSPMKRRAMFQPGWEGDPGTRVTLPPCKDRRRLSHGLRQVKSSSLWTNANEMGFGDSGIQLNIFLRYCSRVIFKFCSGDQTKIRKDATWVRIADLFSLSRDIICGLIWSTASDMQCFQHGAWNGSDVCRCTCPWSLWIKAFSSVKVRRRLFKYLFRHSRLVTWRSFSS